MTTSHQTYERDGGTSIQIDFLGVTVTPMTADEVAEWVTQQDGKRLVLNHNLHSAYLTAVSPDFAELYHRADRTVIDGAPILWFANRAGAGRLTARHRVGSTDWLSHLPAVDSGGLLAVVGATPEVNDLAVERLGQQLDSTRWAVAGMHGYNSWRSTIGWLQSLRPTLVIVGLGMPLQEKFLLEGWEDLPPAVYVTVGGAIDYVAGTNTLAPRWLGAAGLEWLWRLAHEPRRLAHRYVVEPILLARLLVRRRGRARRSDDLGRST